MLVSLSGRKGSGKTTIANVLVEQKGFQKVSVADPLKRYTAELYGWPLAEMYATELKDVPLAEPVVWGPEQAKKLADMIGAERPLSDEPQKFTTRRQALQYIGTEVLRAYDEDFHIKRMVEVLDDDKDYVADDVRFPNELGVVKKRNALCVFLLRPWHFNEVSNHDSEISLRRGHFQNVMLNVHTAPILVSRFMQFLSQVQVSGRQVNQNELENFLKMAEQLGWGKNRIATMAAKHLHYEKGVYGCDDDAFLEPTAEASYWAGALAANVSIMASNHKRAKFKVAFHSPTPEMAQGFVKFTANEYGVKAVEDKKIDLPVYHYQSVVHSPFLLDDLKLWNLVPGKYVSKVPEITQKNPALFSSWVSGLIDAAGGMSYQARNFDGPAGKDAKLEVFARYQDVANLIHQALPFGHAPIRLRYGGFVVRFQGDQADRVRKIVSESPLIRNWQLIGCPHKEVAA